MIFLFFTLKQSTVSPRDRLVFVGKLFLPFLLAVLWLITGDYFWPTRGFFFEELPAIAIKTGVLLVLLAPFLGKLIKMIQQLRWDEG
jgi:hypothetical protein